MTNWLSLTPTNGTRMTYLNNAGDTDIGYDGLRRTVTLRHLEDDDTLIVGFEYGYDRMNNRTFQRKLHDLANSELYEYDSVYRLINFERGELNAQGDAITTPSTNVNQGQEWNLDGLGNWDESTIFDENGNPIVDDREHSSFNELTLQEGATLSYDDNGNLVEDAEYTYQYDSRNRLRIATRKADGVVAEYFYDAMGRRIRKEVTNSGANNGVTDFYYDGQRVVEERDENNVLTQQYVYGNYIDEVLVMDRNLDGDDSAIAVGDQRFHYHQDAQFSVYAVTDENGDILESYLYDPYGKVTVFDANGDIVPDHPWGAANSLIDNPYLFTGRRFDEETGLYYFRARYYDADQGRFISRDPIEYVDGINLYRVYFVPNGVDPSGKFWGWAAAAVGAAVGAVVSTAAYTVTQVFTGGEITAGGLAGAATSGAISGGIVGGVVSGDPTTIIAAGVIAGGLGAGAGSAVQQAIDNGSVDVGQVGESVLIGSVAGGVGAGLSVVANSTITPGGTAALAGGRTAPLPASISVNVASAQTGAIGASSAASGIVVAMTGSGSGSSSFEEPEPFDTPEDAIGWEAMDGLKPDVWAPANNANLRAQGYKQVRYFFDNCGQKWTVHYNPSTGKWCCAHLSGLR